MSRRIRIALLLALLAWGAAVGTAAEPEDELKAATVLAFLRHAEWQQAPAGSVITVGFQGRTSMYEALHRLLEGKIANNRTVHVLSVQRASECRDCQALYLALDTRGELKQIMAGLRLPGLLVMGESDHLLEMGGAANLLIVNGHISFEVSQQALDRSGISISSKLLRYGRVLGRSAE